MHVIGGDSIEISGYAAISASRATRSSIHEAPAGVDAAQISTRKPIDGSNVPNVTPLPMLSCRSRSLGATMLADASASCCYRQNRAHTAARCGVGSFGIRNLKHDTDS
jgi:hypothetical protein